MVEPDVNKDPDLMLYDWYMWWWWKNEHSAQPDNDLMVNTATYLRIKGLPVPMWEWAVTATALQRQERASGGPVA